MFKQHYFLWIEQSNRLVVSSFVQILVSKNLASFVQKVTLKFKSVRLPWEFKQTVKAHEVEINFDRCTLARGCTKADVALAAKKLAAEFLNEAGGSKWR